jgi:hypothetical protein
MFGHRRVVNQTASHLVVKILVVTILRGASCHYVGTKNIMNL